ncbi:MAG: beta-galactosidase trimerization domain-containing protein, partial [Clostridia bacterium]|nr:beta-galactosidase trimerization domain-containing protein [Clostridia bacterium]
LALSMGAKFNVGDQLHPLGKFELATYRLIGEAFAEVEKREAWCDNTKHITDIAVYSTYTYETNSWYPHDIGCNRMLLEGHYLYDFIDNEADFSPYKLVIFPDNVIFDEKLKAKTLEYLENGGRILLSHDSGRTEGGDFFTDFGARYIGENELDATYLVPTYELKPNGIAPYLMYKRGNSVSVDDDVRLFAYMENSYFNRSLRRFCSHANTPNKPGDDLPGAFVKGNVGYICWPVFCDYAENGAYHTKQIVFDMIDALLEGVKSLETSLPSNGIATLTKQEDEKRYINHLLYTVTKPRGRVVEVIEDEVPLYDTKVSLRINEKPVRVYLAPECKDVDFTYESGVLSFTVDKFTTHGMAVIDI